MIHQHFISTTGIMSGEKSSIFFDLKFQCVHWGVTHEVFSLCGSDANTSSAVEAKGLACETTKGASMNDYHYDPVSS